MTTEDLKRLRQAATDAISEVKRNYYINEPIDWGGLKCIEAAEIHTDAGEVRLRVVIAGAAPECPLFHASLAKVLLAEWGEVEVVTEW